MIGHIIRGDTVRMMRAGEYRVHERTGIRECVQHCFLHVDKFGPTIGAAPNARLIGNDNHWHAPRIRRTHGICSTRHHAHVRYFVKIVHFFDQHAVPIQKQRWATIRRARHSCQQLRPDTIVADMGTVW